MFIKREGSNPKPIKVEKPKYKRIRKVSKKLSRELQVYNRVRKIHLEENPNCGRCGKVADQIHHKKGRGEFLNDMRYFLSVCQECHTWIENNPHDSIFLGFSEYRNK